MGAITLRGINRTLLERQFLAEHTARPPLQVVEHLVAMQAQEPNGPYLGLWNRVADFRHEALAALLQDGDVVRSTMLRRTMHLAAAEDFRWLRPTVQPFIRRALSDAYYADEIGGLDLDELAAAGRELLAGRTLSRRELGKLLAERFPDRNRGRLATAVEILIPLAHAPGAGVWGRWGHPTTISVSLAEEWIGRPLATEPQAGTTILRYLAAFGPADVMDIQAWSGLTRLREVVDALRPELRVLHDEDGRELYDLPGAPIAEPDRPAPVRFLPAFDNALLGHRIRTRVIGEDDRKRFAKIASGGVPMFLVDGFVAGTWSTDGSTLSVAPFRPLAPADHAEVAAEAEHLLAFIAPDDGGRAVAFVADDAAPVNRLQAGIQASQRPPPSH